MRSLTSHPETHRALRVGVLAALALALLLLLMRAAAA